MAETKGMESRESDWYGGKLTGLARAYRLWWARPTCRPHGDHALAHENGKIHLGRLRYYVSCGSVR